DIDLDSFNLCPDAVRAAITPRTRAIIPVHFAGQPAEMDAINQIGHEHNLLVLEDAAHAHGAQWRDTTAGSLGKIASFSFQSSKNLASGEGGIITTNDDRLADKCRSLHNCGRVPTGVWYEHHTISANYRLSELQGALLNAQLERLDEQTDIRDANGRYLAERLRQLPGVYPQRIPAECTRHSFHLFMMRLDGQAFGVSRAAVISALHAEGIPCSAGYGYSLNHQPLFRNKAFGPYLHNVRDRLDYSQVRCPNSDLICREQAIWLGQSMFLGSRDDMDDIVRAFEKIHSNRHQLAAWSTQRA
ncbi:MAG: DegT/DnrJ/EryC1/StrS family aminotransferase, partial [Pirellulaceae bacterium]